MALNWTPSMDVVLVRTVEDNPDASWETIAGIVGAELNLTLTKDAVRNRYARARASGTVVIDPDESLTAMRRALVDSRNELEQMKVSRQTVLDTVFNAVEQGIAGIHLEPVLKPPPLPEELVKDRTVLHGTDWQTGKFIRGSYSSGVTRLRVADYIEQSIQNILRNPSPVSEAHWLLTGDLVEGETIFPSQPYRIDQSLFRQVFQVAEMIVDGVRRLLTVVPVVYVEGIGGNHGENLKTSHPETNFDNMAMEIARRLLVDEPRLVFPEPITPDEHHWYMLHDVGDKVWFGIHGHQSRSQPNTNASRSKLLGWHGTSGPFDYAITGHYHQAMMQDIGPFTHWAGGSTENGNTYAAEFLATGAQIGSQWQHFQSDYVHTSHLIRLP